MSTHAAFILAAYGLTFVVIAGMIGVIVREHAALRRALAKFPQRGETKDADNA